MHTTQPNAGWTLSQSVALELDMALSVAVGYFGAVSLPEDVRAFVQSLPAAWQAEAPEMVGPARHLLSLVETAASMAGVLLEDDYSRATLAIREMDVPQALAWTEAQAGRYGLAADQALPPPARLVELWLALRVALYAGIDLPVKPGDPVFRRWQQTVERVVPILRGQELHSRFWHWLDRFYYGFYQPWREGQAGTLDRLETRAVTALGARERWGEPPVMAWLPEIHPLHTHPELAAAVQAGRLRVIFWIEPFGLADVMSLEPGLLLVSFAEPGALYQNFQEFAADVAARTKALADPTRLIILRMIRHFGLINTQMADALGLARPTVSVHAKILSEAGLIRSHRQGRETRHELVPEEVHRLFRDLRELLDLEDGSP